MLGARRGRGPARRISPVRAAAAILRARKPYASLNTANCSTHRPLASRENVANPLCSARRVSAHAFSRRLYDTGKRRLQLLREQRDLQFLQQPAERVEPRLDPPGLPVALHALVVALPPLRDRRPRAWRRAPDSPGTWRAAGRAPSGSAASAPSCAHGVAWKNPGYTRASRRARALGAEPRERRRQRVDPLRQRVVLGGDRRRAAGTRRRRPPAGGCARA